MVCYLLLLNFTREDFISDTIKNTTKCQIARMILHSKSKLPYNIFLTINLKKKNKREVIGQDS